MAPPVLGDMPRGVPLVLAAILAFLTSAAAQTAASLTAKGVVLLSSNDNNSTRAAIIDGVDSTAWQSDACFPTSYMSRASMNPLLYACTNGACTASAGSSPSLVAATDTSVYTAVGISKPTTGNAFFAATLPGGPYTIFRVSVKGYYSKTLAPVTVYVIAGGQQVAVATLVSPTNDYQWVHTTGTWQSVTGIRLESSAGFTLTEIGVQSGPCFEQAAVDMGTIASIGSIRVRHWSGSGCPALNTSLLYSQDGVQYTELYALDPCQLSAVTLTPSTPVQARFLAVRHRVKEADYQKVAVWGIDAYAYVAMPPPSPKPSPPPPPALLPSDPTWDPYAGSVRALSYGGAVTVSSNQDPSAIPCIADGLDNTQWQSDACFPTGYMSRPSMNALIRACATPGTCTASLVAAGESIADSTDLNVYTGTGILPPATGGGPAFLSATLIGGPQNVSRVSVKVYYTPGVPVVVSLLLVGGQSVVVASLVSATTTEWDWTHVQGSWQNVLALRLESAAYFKVTEMAVNVGTCMEEATLDMGSIKAVGMLRVRFWSTEALSTTFLVSADGVAWTTMQTFDPNTLPAVELWLDTMINIRYMKIRHQVKEDGDWRKVYVWGMDAYDQFGRWGAPPPAVPHPMSLRQMMGVNGIWGWGFQQFSDQSLKQGRGPLLYNEVATKARNYHGMNWDVKWPSNNPHYNIMATSGTDGMWWLNWDREYAAWKAAGFQVDASFQFTSKMFPASAWGDNPTTTAYNLGFAFGSHFGPGRAPANCSLASVEVGNEAWDYNAATYSAILRGFASGVKAADPSFPVLPGALQADNPNGEDNNGGNFIGARIPKDVAPQLDALNTHQYSFYRTLDGVRIAVHPEHPGTSFNGLNNFFAWRNFNMPGKPVWVTEWGWDAHLPGTPCANTECVSQHAQAVYGLRGLLVLARKGVRIAHWFFYANGDDCDTLFCRSGLRGSNSTGFPIMPVYTAFKSMFQLVGPAGFQRVVVERPDLYAYLLGTQAGGITHLVAWRPVAAGEGPEDDVLAAATLALARTPAQAWYVNGNGAQQAALPSVSGDVWSMSVSQTPLLVQLA